jgi:PAS domain-containing protein
MYADLIRGNNERRKVEEALRASEERWSKLAENSSAGIALFAPDGRFIAANLALQKMLGYTEDEWAWGYQSVVPLLKVTAGGSGPHRTTVLVRLFNLHF